MKVLFCGGSEKAGSWKMRGEQIASVYGWKAISNPSEKDIQDSDIVVVVKRFNSNLIEKIKKYKKPLVWDALDFWPQSKDAHAPNDLPEAIMLARKYVDKIQPDLIVAANKQMQDDFRLFFPDSHVIYHHHRLDAFCVKGGDVVYFDGCEKHSEKSLEKLKEMLPDFGLKLKIGKPEDDACALFAGRDDWTGWLAKRWKSNVKAANAIAYNLPLICQEESGYLETLPDSHALYYTKSPYEALGQIRKVREPVAGFPLDYVAAQYRRLLESTFSI